MKVDQPAVRGEESAACAQLSKSCSSPGGTVVQEEEEEEEEGEGTGKERRRVCSILPSGSCTICSNHQAGD